MDREVEKEKEKVKEKKMAYMSLGDFIIKYKDLIKIKIAKYEQTKL